MSTEPETDAPFQWGDVVMARYEGTEMPSAVAGQVRGLGTYPAPWVRILTSEGETVVFLGPGVTVRMMNDLKRR